MTGDNRLMFNYPSRLIFIGLALLLSLVLTLLLIGVNQPAAARSAPVKVGLIPDISGIHDKSFNEASFQGLLRAQSQLGIVGTVYTPTNENDYGPKIVQCAQEGNDLCIGVGFLMQNQIANAAGLFPQTKFTIVDVQYDTYPANLRGMVFASPYKRDPRSSESPGLVLCPHGLWLLLLKKPGRIPTAGAGSTKNSLLSRDRTAR